MEEAQQALLGRALLAVAEEPLLPFLCALRLSVCRALFYFVFLRLVLHHWSSELPRACVRPANGNGCKTVRLPFPPHPTPPPKSVSVF